MPYHWIHDITFYVMYAAAILATFVIVERFIFYIATLRDARKLEKVLAAGNFNPDNVPATLRDKDSIPLDVLRQMMGKKPNLTERADLEDTSQAIFIAMQAPLHRHLWLLDTIVTAAPLLGLLGTILGIIDTFTTLAHSGISDPSAVSRGIGTALFATALGIAIALYGLVFFNLFHERVERINDHLKVLLLRASVH